MSGRGEKEGERERGRKKDIGALSHGALLNLGSTRGMIANLSEYLIQSREMIRPSIVKVTGNFAAGCNAQ